MSILKLELVKRPGFAPNCHNCVIIDHGIIVLDHPQNSQKGKRNFQLANLNYRVEIDEVFACRIGTIGLHIDDLWTSQFQ